MPTEPPLHPLPSTSTPGEGVAEHTRRRLPRLTGSGGQTTAEYALVVLGAAALALLVLAWTTRTSRIGRLLDAVFDSIVDKVV